MNDVVWVALLGLVATVISGAVGALGQPWITDRIEKDREQRAKADAKVTKAEQQYLDLQASMMELFDDYETWSEYVTTPKGRDASIAAKRQQLRCASLAEQVQDDEVREAGRTFAAIALRFV